MAICRCGCGSKVLFLRSYMSKRSVEFWAVARFGAAVNNDFLSRPIQDFSKPEIETFRQFLKQKTLSCLNHREKLHEYAQGRIDESDLPTRQQAWDDESQLIALAVSSADFLVRSGVIDKKELASELARLSIGQRRKVAKARDLLPQSTPLSMHVQSFVTRQSWYSFGRR